ncbi:hypothetical protein LCGC14_1121970 [marine sediment metagenome]|uniref:Calcineurin-like phosphoesterase domain-containing protein n=1 Tax=marine sediment metagenome TaxID=412755 RepID=A0A0F9PLV4_9ZZZZ
MNNNENEIHVKTHTLSMVLISPNLGLPQILGIDHKLKHKDFQIDLLFISKTSDLNAFNDNIFESIALIPLFDYQWTPYYKELIRKKSKKGFWVRWKERRAIKKEKNRVGVTVQIKATVDTIVERIKQLKSRLHRGKPVLPKIIKVEQVPINPIHDVVYINKLSPQEHLLKNQVFGDLDQFYNVKIEFTLSKEVLKFLRKRQFVMFDIEVSESRINYHSLVISKQNWKNFKFNHATDLHLAERNDRIYGIVKQWTESSVKENVDNFFKTVKKKLKFDKKKREQDQILSDIKIPLRKRLINPNNQMRKFIKLSNKQVLRNELDFIVLTGDLVDYTTLSRISKKKRALNELKFEETNWQILKKIILNEPLTEKHKGIKRGEELSCPIFTAIGNHDFRPNPYDLTWGEMFRKIGLNAGEAIALNEMFSASPITAITKSPLALKWYLSEINPFFDFSLKLGNNLFIILNSGSDSFKNIRDLLSGHPSVTGVSIKQIKYLENLLNSKIIEGKKINTFLFLHGPPINTGVKKFKLKLFEKKGARFIKQKIQDLKESLIKKLGQPLFNARVDGVFNVKFGCVSSNWEKLLEFCKNFTVLTLCGHTHDDQEFRLGDPGEFKTQVYDAPPFKLKRIENPAAIYYDNYSEIDVNAKAISENGPYVVQTPALGLGSHRHPESAGAYREIIVKGGKLSSFRIKYINR